MGGHNTLLLTLDFLPVYVKKSQESFHRQKNLHLNVSFEM